MCIKFSTGRILPVILDIGCGEGWYTRRIADALKLATIEAHILGVDISKTAVRLAAKDAAGIQYVVASMRRLPCMDQSIDVIVSIFAPLHFPEVRRVLKKDGKVIVVRPGQHHLQQFKSALGLTTLLHEEPALGEHDTGMKTAGTESVTGTLLLPTQDDIMNLCRMTTMFWRSSPDAQASLSRLQKLETDIDFHATVLSFKKLSVHAHRSRQAET